MGVSVSVSPQESFAQDLESANLERGGILREVDEVETVYSKRVLRNGDGYLQPLRRRVYVGYYDGPFAFVDGECEEVREFMPDDLEWEFEKGEIQFTDDIRAMYEKYRDYIKPIER